MLGAHLDSWTGGTGAADDAAGCAVMMEAMRILKSLDLKMDRTVRLALWSAEEQGLLGSRAYVTDHFADRQTMALKPEHAVSPPISTSIMAAARFAAFTCRETTWRARSSKPGWRRSRILAPPQSPSANHGHGSPLVRCRRPARIPVHSRPAGIRYPHAPRQPGCLRARAAGRPDAGRGHCGLVRIQRRDAARAAPAQATAQTPVAPRPGVKRRGTPPACPKPQNLQRQT